MTIKSIAELLAQADATLADNTVGDISAADVRTMIKDFLDTIAPAYGAMTLTGPSAELLSPTPAVIAPWTTNNVATPDYYLVSAANGQITRLIAAAGLAGGTDLITVSGGVNGANNSNVTVELFINGAASGIKSSVTCSGGTDIVGFNFAGLRYNAVDTTYELRASGPAGTYNFSNVEMILQSQPVRSFV